MKEAESLYVEKIELGEKEARTVVSGIKKWVKKEDFVGRKVLVVCNLKPRVFAQQGITSYGLVLCASNQDHSQVELLKLPEESEVGELLRAEGVKVNESFETLHPKKKVWESVSPKLSINSDLQALYDGKPLFLSKGNVCSSSIVGTIG